MDKDDIMKIIPEADKIKDNLEKNLKKHKVTASSKNGMVTVVMNYQQEISDLIIENRLLDPGKSGVLKTSLIEALNQAIKSSRNKMLEETAKAVNLFK